MLSVLEFGFVSLNSAMGKGDETITVTMRGQTPAAHADDILEHYNFAKADEAKFKELYGFDLRQNLTDAYSKKDNKAAHTALGKEGAGLGGGILGDAVGGAAAGLICGPGAPVCSGIGIFVGGAIGAFVASGGYDWLTSK